MKQNRFTKLLAGGVACALALSTALAQDSSTTTTTTAGADASTTTTATTSTGTISALAPDMLTVRTESSTTPMTYYYSKSTTVVDPEGHTVEFSALRPETPATFYYTRVGDRIMVTKVVLTKPASFYEKKETTTTTTTNP
jgi:hypothetical protein